MTSKEALKELKEEKIYLSNVNANEVLDAIEKDLEILEILKNLINHLEATFNTKYFSDSGIMGTIIKDYFINNDITGKIEEWLNNDN